MRLLTRGYGMPMVHKLVGEAEVVATERDTTKVADVANLRVAFATSAGIAAAVRGISFSIARGETVGLVGESGSGKSVTALSLMKLLPQRGVRIEADRLTVMGTEVMTAGAKDLQELRGGRVAMVLQNPLRSLNPTKRIGGQIGEAIHKHESLSPNEVKLKIVDLLGRVGIPEPERRVREYPHQFSGGQRQRIMIAMAIACSPGLLIADEPTTALDVTTQAQIFDLILDLRAELGMAMFLITHDLSVVARVCDRVLVMYAGRLIETAPARGLFRRPLHPYTAGLLASIPRIDQPDREIAPIRGTPLDATVRVEGCAFRPRCPYSFELCSEQPSLDAVGPDRLVACWRSQKGL
jgi:oligopeptide transport system ATP-binding protein